MRKFLFLLTALFTVIGASAQLAPGTWHQYSVYGSSIDKIIDSDKRVYYVNSGFLYGYDKEADETLTYDRSNLLSDVKIKSIFYNHEKHFLAVAYDNGNIDLIYDNGNVVNLPDIKDATLTVAPSINDIAFDGDNMYVATNFGLVVYDQKKHEVRQSGIYKRDVSHVIPLDKLLVIVSEKNHYTIDKDAKINKFENFTLRLEDLDCTAYVVSDKEAGVYYGNIWSVVARLEVNQTTGEMKRSNFGGLGSYVSPSNLIGTDDYIIFVTEKGRLFQIEKATNKLISLGDIPSPLLGDMISTRKDLDKLWAVNAHGLGLFDITEGNVTVLNDRMKPSGTSTVVKPAFFFPTTDKKNFYISNLGRTHFRPAGNGEGTRLLQLADRFEDGKFISVAPENVTAAMPSTVSVQNQFGSYGIVNPTRLVEDPDDPSIIYMGSGSEGVYVIKDGEQIGKFDSENSPLPSMANAGWRVLDLKIDRAGNLWVGMHDFEDYLFVLPAAKRKANPSTVTASDWINVTKEKMTSYKDLMILPCEKSNMVLCIVDKEKLMAIDTRGTWSNFNDDQVKMYNSFLDQDGKTVSMSIPFCMVEDQDGKVWIGTSGGVIEITRPANLMNADFRINHLKVPRNDGTNLADYLLDKDQVNDITVDNSNRKWIATEASGVYLVSPAGDEIIEHFTSENSMLPANEVFCIYAHPDNNSIFIGTNYGISQYSSSSSPAREDYSDVYAYPNPVTPDYTGWVTITGLMRDSRVKICDSALNVVSETRSEGGMASWDLCNFSGVRVRSGVYYVLASTGTDGTDSAADVVAKILVIN